jgi:hypothetical protein
MKASAAAVGVQHIRLSDLSGSGIDPRGVAQLAKFLEGIGLPLFIVKLAPTTPAWSRRFATVIFSRTICDGPDFRLGRISSAFEIGRSSVARFVTSAWRASRNPIRPCYCRPAPWHYQIRPYNR